MIALLRVEAKRFLSRRLFRVVTAVVMLAFVLVGVIILNFSDNSPAAMDAARVEHRTNVERCISEAGNDGVPAVNPETFCAQNNEFQDPRFPYREARWILLSLGLPLMMLALLIGSSFVGAEWHHRTMTSLLTWEPRRRRVLGAKAIVAFLFSSLWALLLLMFLAGVLYPVAAARGTVSGLDADWWVRFLGTVARVSSLAGLASLLGASIAFIGRNTAAALGAAFAYLAVVEGLVRAFRPAWVGWLIGDNAGQYVSGEILLSHSQLASALLLVVYATALLLLAALIFKRREIA